MLEQRLAVEREIPAGAALGAGGQSTVAALAQAQPWAYIRRGERQPSPSSRDSRPVPAVARIPPGLGDRVHLFTQPLLAEGEGWREGSGQGKPASEISELAPADGARSSGWGIVSQGTERLMTENLKSARGNKGFVPLMAFFPSLAPAAPSEQSLPFPSWLG